MNYEDTSGHIALSRIIGGVVGAGAGAWVGSKIAKKTNAKGWKKAAIIAGCAVAGGVIGAIAGPRVAKLAKKVVNIKKPKLKPKMSTLQKSTSKKASKGVMKTVSKAKKAISSTAKVLKSPKTKQKLAETGWDMMMDGAIEAGSEYVDGGSAKRGAYSGGVSALVGSMVKNPFLGSALGSLTANLLVRNKDSDTPEYLCDMIVQSVIGSALGKLGACPEVENMRKVENISVGNFAGLLSYDGITKVFGEGVNIFVDGVKELGGRGKE